MSPMWSALTAVKCLKELTSAELSDMAKKPMKMAKAMKAFEKADKKSDAKEMKMAMKKAGKKGK